MKKSTKLIRCDGKKCKHKKELCLEWNNGVLCTLPEGHKGNHIACVIAVSSSVTIIPVEHNLKIWH